MKLIKLFLIVFQAVLINIKFNQVNIEDKLNRYIKINRKNISIEIHEEQLFAYINYAKSLKQNENEEVDYKIINNPKISFISTVFNQRHYLSSFISSIQKQELKDYEVIFIDDFSIDKSDELISEKAKKDRRIKLIKNKNNKGALYSRYIGLKMSKSNYSIFLDCDDIVLKYGILNSYNHIIKFNLDIVQFLTIWQEKNSISLKTNIYKYNNIIYKPILSYIFYYDNEKKIGTELNYALWDKIVKKDLLNKAFEYIGYIYLLRKKIIIHNDLILLFSIFQCANSYQYINEIGYYYFKTNKNSTTNSWNVLSKRNEIIDSLFLNIQFLYIRTNDTYLDKCFCIYVIRRYFQIYNKLFYYLSNQQYYYIINIINKLLNLNYLPVKEKLNLIEIEMSISNMK